MRILLLFAVLFTLIGCASRTSVGIRDKSPGYAAQTASGPGSTSVQTVKTTLPLYDIRVSHPDFAISDFLFDGDDTIMLADTKLHTLFKEFDVPITMTPRVQHYIKYFTGNAQKSMQMWIDRSNMYMYIVKDIFEREGLPQDLVVLSFTESGFNPMAYSRAGAGGMWQFMPGTGRMYNLNVNDWVDERRDFEKATVAAARHLKDLYDMFDDWHLALAAYNAGSGKINNATKKHKSKDFFTIATGSTLKAETKDYVPKYLAQLIIYKNMIDYGFTPPSALPLLYDNITVTEPVNLLVIAEKLGCSSDELKRLNPELKTPMTPPVTNYSLRIPAGTQQKVTAMLNDPAQDLSRYKVYQAKSGENIAAIAKKHNVSAKAVKTLNSIHYDTIYSSKVLFIPKSNNVSAAVDTAFIKEIGTLAPKYYTVKKGDNMTLISKKHNIPLRTLVQLNPKVNPSKIYPGQVLVVSQGGLKG